MDLFYGGTLRDSIVRGNTAPDGAGIVSIQGTVENLLVANNTASGNGGQNSGATDHGLDGTPRPLDGDNNGTATADVGCYEYLDPSADSDGDGLTDGEELGTYGTDPTNDNTDGDPMNDGDEHIADTDPLDDADYFHITGISNNSPVTVYFDSSSNRWYTMIGCSNLLDGAWTNVPGAEKQGTGGADMLQDTNGPPRGPFHRLEVELP